MYGERGVWRPGDSLYLTFVMEDKENILPVNHPVNFELINPQGQIVKRIVKTAHTNGFYDFRTATTPDAITGNYTGKVSVGNRTYSKYLKIETVKPNRLKIYVDFGGKMIKSGSDPDGELEVKWLHGATAGNLKAKVDMTVSKTKTAFKKFKSYHFDDVSNNFSSDEFTVFDGKLNDQGKSNHLTWIELRTFCTRYDQSIIQYQGIRTRRKFQCRSLFDVVFALFILCRI